MLILEFVQRKYESEIGETMEKPKEKLKKILIIAGITGAVYAGCKYLLPLVIPFFAAYGTAVLLEPSARWIQKKLSVKIGERRWKIPIEIIGGAELTAALFALGAGIYLGGCRLIEQAKLLTDALPQLIKQFDTWLTGHCRSAEEIFHLKSGYVVCLMQDMLRELGVTIKAAAMPYLMVNSVSVFQWIVGGMVILLVMFLATVLTLGKLEAIRRFEKRSLFREEFAVIHEKFGVFVRTYLRVQGVVLLLTMAVCMAGLWAIKNPYYILLGIGIGLLDALPLFGTGTVLAPWALVELVAGRGGKAAVLIGLYVLCYILRQVLETRMMAKGMGLSALETLVALYAGLELFGVWGVVLGPAALMISKALLEILETAPGRKK